MKQEGEKMKPEIFRMYKKHRSMIKDLIKVNKNKKISHAGIVRIAIEKMHTDIFSA